MLLHYRTNDSGRWRIYLGLNTVTENDALVQFVQPGNRKKSSTNVFSFRDCMSSVYFVVWCKWNLLLEIRNVVVVGSNQVVGSKLECPAARFVGIPTTLREPEFARRRSSLFLSFTAACRRSTQFSGRCFPSIHYSSFSEYTTI